MSTESLYTSNFYKLLQEGSQRSAREIVPLVLKLIQPNSVVDVGCGSGTWLSVFKEYGVSDILGIDGDYIDKTILEIPEEQFLSFDLRKPFDVCRQFDLVVSLEVAEHLPSECAETFVNSLIKLGPAILFSAAIPFQGGTNHINEQWPNYWVRYFNDKGYVAIDLVRKNIWQNDSVEFWYIQNILMYVKQECLESSFLLKNGYENTSSSQLSIVHPKKYLEIAKQHTATVENYQSQSEKLQSQLHQAQAELEGSQSQLHQTQAELEQFQGTASLTKSQLQQRQAELSQAQATISSIQSSKFWRLRKVWFKVKRLFLKKR